MKTAIGLLTVILVLNSGLAASEPETPEGLLFHATFDDGLNADYAAGYGLATLQGDRSDEIRIVQGLVGQGVLIGASDAQLTYATEGNLDTERGTIELWYKPVGWGPKKPPSDAPNAEGFHFKRWWFASGNVWLYQSYHAGFLSNPKTIYNLRPPYEDADRWRYVVLTWDRTIPETTVYADVHHVRPNTSKEAIAAMKFGDVMEIGNHANNGDSAACDKVIDEVRIWNRQLGPEEIAHHYRERIQLHTDPRIRVRKTGQQITIDGVLDKTEWSDATVIGGLTGAEKVSLSPVRSRFLLTYDRTHLYVGMHSDLPADAKGAKANKLLYGMVKADVADHDSDVDQDDALRILVWEQKHSRLYRLLANSLGTTYDAAVTYGPDDDGALRPIGHEPAWEPKWTTKSTVDMDGWHLEAAIPLADLEIEPTQGRELRLHLGRIWKRLRQGSDHWAVGVLNDVTGNRVPVANLGTIVLAGDEAVSVAIDRFDISSIDRETIELLARVRNHGDSPRELSVSLQVDRKSASPRAIVLDGGETFEFASKVQLAQINDALHFAVTEGSDPPVVHYRQTVPVHSPHKLAIRTRHYLTDRVMSISWRLAQISAPLDDVRGSVRILAEPDGPVVREQTDIRFDRPISETEISTRGIPSGAYRVETIVRHEDRVLANVHTAFDLKVAEDWSWYGNDIGFPTEVPPPWTAMTWDRDDDTIHCWGRQTHYANKLLPTQIVNQDKPMLAAPMQLELTTTDGGAVRFGEAHATVEWKQQNSVEMNAARSETLGPVGIRIESVSEFDGFVWMDVTVSPRGDAPTAISGLSLVAPLKAEWANLVNVSDYSMSKTGALPDDFRGNLGATWIGNGLGGIQFLSETTAPWGLKSPHHCLTVRRADGVATVRINLIDRPIELAEPRTFSLGFMVTPVKPRPKNYRRWILGPKDPAQAYEVLGRKGGIYLPLFIQGWSKLYSHDFDGHPLAEHYPDGPFPEEFRAVDVETPGGTASKDVCLYVSANRVPANSEEHERWGDEWVIDATQPTLINAGYGPRLCPGAPSMVDWRVWGMAETMKVLGNRGYYFDVGFPEWCNNRRHGCGTLDRDGKPLPTWSILPHRRFLKRLYVALKQVNPDSLITYHSSGTAYMPMYSFCDLLLDGENYYGALNTTDRKSYEKFLTLDSFRAQHLGHNLGAVSALLPQFRRRGSITYPEAEEIFKRDGEVRPYNYVIGLVLLHDALLWPSYMWAGSGCYEFSKLLGELNFDERYAFHPYWSQQIVDLPEKIVASFYVDEEAGRVLMVLMNVDTGDDRRLTLNPDWSRLGLDPATAHIRNALHGEPVTLSPDGTLEIPAPTLTYRMFVIEP